MSCESACYEAQVNGCGDITLKAGLPAATAFYLRMSKSGTGNVYQRPATTDVDGFLVISKDAFPTGYFTPGFYNLSVKKASDYTLQPLTFNATPYNCVLFQIVNTNVPPEDDSPISTIQ